MKPELTTRKRRFWSLTLTLVFLLCSVMPMTVWAKEYTVNKSNTTTDIKTGDILTTQDTLKVWNPTDVDGVAPNQTSTIKYYDKGVTVDNSTTPIGTITLKFTGDSNVIKNGDAYTYQIPAYSAIKTDGDDKNCAGWKMISEQNYGSGGVIYDLKLQAVFKPEVTGSAVYWENTDSAVHDGNDYVSVTFRSTEAFDTYWYVVKDAGEDVPSLDDVATGDGTKTEGSTGATPQEADSDYGIELTNGIAVGKIIYLVVKSTDGVYSGVTPITIKKAYAITADPSGAQNFDSVTLNKDKTYASDPGTKTVTITNTGVFALKLKVTESATAATQADESESQEDYFNATWPGNQDAKHNEYTLPSDSNVTLTIQPKAGLSAGDYNRTLTVNAYETEIEVIPGGDTNINTQNLLRSPFAALQRGVMTLDDNGTFEEMPPVTSVGIPVSFTVNNFYAISMSQESIDFGSVALDADNQYAQPKAQTVTVTNDSTGTVYLELSAPDQTYFNVSQLTSTSTEADNGISTQDADSRVAVEPGNTATFTVQPSDSLGSGPYATNISVQAFELENSGDPVTNPAYVEAKFVVKKFGLSVTPHQIAMTATEGYAAGSVTGDDNTVTVENTGSNSELFLQQDVKITDDEGKSIDTFDVVWNNSISWNTDKATPLQSGANLVTFTVQPKVGLAAGTYTGKITVTAYEIEDHDVTVDGDGNLGSEPNWGKSYEDSVTVTFTVTKSEDNEVPSPNVPSGDTGGSTGNHNSTKYTLTYDTNGGTSMLPSRHSRNETVKLAELKEVTMRAGYSFVGWFADEALTTPITEIKMDSNKTVYAGWAGANGSESNAGGVGSLLNVQDHIAYMGGYEDGYMKPEKNITRAEAAMTFFRLLLDEVREANYSEENPFLDVQLEDWYNVAISTMTELGILKGRTAETYAPNAAITRAEFATICARFDTSEVDTSGVSFTDIAGHWAEEDILRAAALGWIEGYENGSFRPNDFITRAEVITMMNRLLCRQPETEDDLLPGMKTWPDVAKNAWYYVPIQEATNGHTYVYKSTDTITDTIYEHWLKVAEFKSF